mgnify:CR=1 FL=1
MKKFFIGLAVLLLLVLLVPLFVAIVLKISLPKPQAEHRLIGLLAPVKVLIDDKGVPTIHAGSIEDLAFAQGYVVARDRLFQMDLMRRQSAGRLAEIVGDKALPIDRTMRFYGFEKVADLALEKMSNENRYRLEAYAKGVNAFLAEGPRPWETRVLNYSIEPWKPRDSVLVALNLYNTLNHPSNEDELTRQLLVEKRPREIVDLLTAEYGFFDAPILKETSPPVLPGVPGPEIFTIREKTAFSPFKIDHSIPVEGSNAWVIAGARALSGVPILSGDPHLKHMAPNIWYRLELKVEDLEIIGVTLPGIPGVVIGTNGNTAWSFTNPDVDNVDFVPIQRGTSENTYMAYGKELNFQTRSETYLSKKNPVENQVIRETVWGPVKEIHGKEYALQWSARDSDVLKDLDMFSMNQTKNLVQAFQAMSRWAGPPQNLIVADKEGHIGWALVGKIPKKIGMDGRIPVERDETHDWKGYYAFSDQPHVIDPPEGYIANGNQRQVPIDENLFRWGNRWHLPARAYRIEEVLKTAEKWEAKDMFALQNDIHSHTHLWYRDRLVESIAKEKEKSQDKEWLSAIEENIKNFDGKLKTDSAAYPFLKRFRFELKTALVGPLLVDVVPSDLEESLMQLVENDTSIRVLLDQKPLHLLAKPYQTYEECVVRVAVKLAKEMSKTPDGLKKLRWGDVNQALVRHPLSRALPDFVGRYLDMAKSELSGDELVPRVNKPHHGASMRMNIDLSDIQKSIYNHPGGQSGHILSSHYRDEFAAWVDGTAERFTPGPTEFTEVFNP